MKNTWSEQDLEKLRNDYRSGKRIKIIAHELNRTEASVCKTISRLGITRRTRKKVFTQTQTRKPKPKTAVTTNSTSYVGFSTVREYLQSKGYNISNFSSPLDGIYHDDEVFIIGNKPMTKMKILLFANRLRVEEKKPIFSSQEITWS